MKYSKVLEMIYKSIMYCHLISNKQRNFNGIVKKN